MTETATAPEVGAKVKLLDGSGYAGQEGVYKGQHDDGCHSVDVHDLNGAVQVYGAHLGIETFEVVGSPIPPVGTRVRVSKGTYGGRVGKVVTGHHPDGLYVDVLDDEGNIDMAGVYVLSSATPETVADWIEVIETPTEWAFPKYALVRFKTVPGAKGIVVAQDGTTLTVMRVGPHLGDGTQDWPIDETELDGSNVPLYKTAHGEFPLGQRVVFTGDGYDGMKGTIVGHGESNPVVGEFTYFLLDEEQEGFDTRPEWFSPDNKDKGTMFSPSSCSWEAVVDLESLSKVDTGKKSKDGETIYVGDLLEYVPGNKDWAGAQVTAVTPGSSSLSPQKYALVTLTPYLEKADYVVGQEVGLLAGDLRHVVETDAEPVAEQLGDHTYPDGSAICVGDRVIRTKGDGSVPTWTLATVVKEGTAQTVTVERDDGGLVTGWSVGTFEKLGAPIGYQYTDGVEVKVGDRVVYNPGHGELSGKTATVVGKDPLYKKARVARDDGSQEAVLWTVSRISRLQDEDKEKVADEAPVPVEAVAALEDLFDQFDSAKDDLDESVALIDTELSYAEQNYPSYSIDGGGSVGVSTDPDKLVGFVSIELEDLELSVSVDDGAVDEYFREIAEVDMDGVDVSIDMESHLSDLHDAVKTGQERLSSLYEMVESMKAIFEQALGEAGVESKIVTTKAATFEGKITNARFGVVLPEDADTGPTLRFDVVADYVESGSGDSSGTKATRRVRLTGPQIGAFMASVAVSDAKHLEGRTAVLTETPYGGWYPTAVSEV